MIGGRWAVTGFGGWRTGKASDLTLKCVRHPFRRSEPRRFAPRSPAHASVRLPECENSFSPARAPRAATAQSPIPKFFEADECVRHSFRRSEPRQFAPRSPGRIINKYLPTGIHSRPYPDSGSGGVGEGGGCLASGDSAQQAKNDFRTPDDLPCRCGATTLYFY